MADPLGQAKRWTLSVQSASLSLCRNDLGIGAMHKPTGIKAALPIVAALLLSACETSPRDFETPTGPVSGDIAGPLVILGVASRATSTLNRPNADQPFEEEVKVNVPVGTEAIIPTVRGWTLGYGSLDPADQSPQPDPNGSLSWKPEDHHLGLATVNVAVSDIDAPDVANGTQTATIVVSAWLTDDNTDDKWFGTIRYNLIYLGRPPGRVPIERAERPVPPAR